MRGWWTPDKTTRSRSIPEVPGVRVTLCPVAAPSPPPPIPRAPGYGDDEWAGLLADGRVLGVSARAGGPLPPRSPAARRRRAARRAAAAGLGLLRPLRRHRPAASSSVARAAPGVLDADGTMTTLLDEPDGDGVHVCWLPDGTAVAAGWRTVAFDGPAGRRRASVQPRGRRLRGRARPLVVSRRRRLAMDQDGRVLARDWRPYAEARGDVVISSAGDGYRVRVSAG